MASRQALRILGGCWRSRANLRPLAPVFAFHRCVPFSSARLTAHNSAASSSSAASSGVTYPLKLASVSENHGATYQESLRNPEQFWGDLARRRLRWVKEFDQVMDCDMTGNKINWFRGGVINVSENCIDRHAEQDPDRVALIWEKDEPDQHETVTYKQLLDMTCQVANALKTEGVKKGDRVAIYMPVTPHLVASMLACARIGAVHSIVFAGFSAEALRSRILDASASIVITADEGVRGGKVIPLKQTVDEAVKGVDCVRKVFVSRRTGGKVPLNDRDIPLEEAMSREPTECQPEPLDSEDNLFMLYTSGSTGKPKGIVHSQAGYLLYASMTHQFVFDYHPGDIYCCVADIGWITGHSYVVYGPLCNGATTVLFESIPTYPDAGRYWEMVERLKIKQFYTSPTAIRLLIKAGDEHVHKYDRSTLTRLGCVGEPLNDEAWQWYHQVVGEERCTVVDTWWQTETGGIMITPQPGPHDHTLKPGFPMRPFWGVDPMLVDDKGRELTGNGVSGNLCIRNPWPSMARTVYGDHNRFLDMYYRPYPDLYFSGDGAYRDEDGHYQITGRVDDVINVKGHRIGTAELESCMDHDPRVAESAVVGFPHDTFGEGNHDEKLGVEPGDKTSNIYAFVILKDDVTDSEDDIIKHLQLLIRKQIGGFAVPYTFLITPGLPKTRSGKIMRRILRKIAANQPDQLGDISTLADPSVVQKIIEKHEQKNNSDKNSDSDT